MRVHEVSVCQMKLQTQHTHKNKNVENAITTKNHLMIANLNVNLLKMVDLLRGIIGIFP